MRILTALITALLLMPAMAASSDWEVNKRVDRMTDQSWLYLSTEAKNTVTLHGRKVRPELIVICDGSPVDIYVHFGRHVTVSKVTGFYRFDDKVVMERPYWPVNDNNAMRLSDYVTIRRLTVNHRLRLQFAPPGHKNLFMEFSLMGFTNLYKQHTDLCVKA